MPKITEHTRTIWQNLAGNNVFLACSGGVDSMVLLDVLQRTKIDVRVIHVNYQLRGEDSDRDAQFIETTCRKLNIPLEIRVIQLNEQLKNGGNLQEEARKIRYSWFDEILRKDSNNRVLLAHHQADQVETFMMNLARKSGVLGLACMIHEHGGVIRPLLDFSKAEILSYAKNHSIEWREDQSNSKNDYTRNRLRNEFIPFIHTKIKDFDASVLTLVEAFQAKQIELEQKVRPFVETVLVTGNLLIAQFEQLDEFEQLELLRRLGISSSYLPRLQELKERGKRLEFAQSVFQSVVRDELQFTFLKEEYSSFELLVEQVDSLPETFSKSHVYLDPSKIRGELRVRKWQIGDRISPIGMDGTQLVSDIIKDAKITADAKRNQLVVHDDRQILWCIGLKIGRGAIADSDSTEILRCAVIGLKAEESEAL